MHVYFTKLQIKSKNKATSYISYKLSVALHILEWYSVHSRPISASGT